MKRSRTVLVLFVLVLVFVVCAPFSFGEPDSILFAHAEDTTTPGQSWGDWAIQKLWGGVGTVAGVTFDYTLGPIITYFGIGLVFLAGKFLTLTAVVFNWAFEKTVMDLPGTLDMLGITGGLEIVWGAFRDIANIVIIGVMVYIAIATIIGLEEYGYKKLLAGTLVVATLINFSLFFSRFAIDAANIVSYQVYNSIKGSNNNMTVGDVLVGRAGVTTWAQTKETVQRIANSPDGGVWNGFLYSIITCGILGMFAAIFLYGSFLLISRGVLLVFLMITSSVAFASRLLPAWRKASYGWDKWKETLIDAAVFGPVLTFLLWVSLTLLNKTTVKGNIGDAIDGGMRGGTTSNSGSWDALMVSLFTIAFLYISIKVAHKLSGDISGFNMTAKAFGLSSDALSIAGRFGGLGWAANRLSQTKAAQFVGKIPIIGRLSQAALYGAGTGSWDPRNLPGFGHATKAFGIDVGKAKGEGGYYKYRTDKEKELNKELAAKRDYFGQETSGERKDRQDHEDRVETSKKAEGEYKSALSAAEAEKKEIESGYQKRTTDATEKMEVSLKELQTKLAERQAEEKRAVNAGDLPGMMRSQEEATRLEAEIQTQSARIQRVKTDIEKEKRLDKKLESVVARIGEAKTGAEREKASRDAMEKAFVRPEKERKLEYADAVQNRRYLTTWGSASKSKDLANKLRKDIKESQEEKDKKRLRDFFSSVDKEKGEEKKPEGGEKAEEKK